MSKKFEWEAHYEEIKDELDPGIRDYVKILMENGVRSFSSCEGGKADGNTHFWHEPTICFHGGMSAAFRAMTVAMNHGLPVDELICSWSALDHLPSGLYWRLTFTKKANT